MLFFLKILIKYFNLLLLPFALIGDGLGDGCDTAIIVKQGKIDGTTDGSVRVNKKLGILI